MQEQQIMIKNYDYGLPAQHYAAIHTQSRNEDPLQLIESDSWKQLSDALYDYGYGKIEEKAILSSVVKGKLIELYQLLITQNIFNLTLQSKTSGQVTDDAIQFTPLLRDRLMRVDLLKIYGTNPTPLHDHPGQAGVFLCLEKPVIFTQYDEKNSTISRNYPITKLNRTRCDTLNKGEIICLDPNWGNILELQSLSQCSLLLSARYQCEEASRPNWYFPITPKRLDQSSFFAQRITRYG